MNYREAYEIALNLDFDTPKTVYEDNMYQIFLLRPSKLSNRFKNYDKNKNFQIFLKINNDESFKPNHLRMLIDLKLRVRERNDLKYQLLEAFDMIYYGENVEYAIASINDFEYTQFIDPIIITAYLSLFFIVEQDMGYGDKSKFSPPSVYIQGWIRTFIDSCKEIDEIIMRICRNTPPTIKYTCQDDKNHKLYNPNATPLWYIGEE